MKSSRCLVAFCLATTLCSGVLTAASAQQAYVTVGTGAVVGVYYPTGGAVCRMVNKTRAHHGIRCFVEPTEGSTDNINAIRAGDIDLGLAQSDWQYHAYHGSSRFEDSGAFKELRAVFSIYPEPVTLIARRDAGIRTFEDLKGKRVNIGSPGSGARGAWDVLEQEYGWERDDLQLATELKPAEMGQALCGNNIDAFLWMIGHPEGLTDRTVAACQGVIAELSGPVIDDLVSRTSYYRTATIPGGMYAGNPSDIKTFGVGATLVTSTKTPAKVIYNVVKAVFDDLEGFKAQHPAFAYLKQAEMIQDGLTAPLHEGALRYFREREWM